MKHFATLLLAFLPIATLWGQENSLSDATNTLPPQRVFVTPQLRFIDNIKWYDFNMSSITEYAPSLTSPIVNGNPYVSDFTGNGAIATWNGGQVGTYGTRSTLPGLMSIESGGITLSQNFGKLTLTVSADAYKYGYFRGLHSNYGFHGSATYAINNNIALTLFGTYYSDAFYHSPAAMPYIGQTAYGGYMTIGFNDKFGVDLGVQRTRNAYNGTMETVPIVRPYYRFSKDFSIGIDAGYLVKDLFWDSNHSNPTIGPPRPNIPIAPRN